MLELLFLLLPVAAASGWLVARKGLARRAAAGGEPDPAYFRGLNYLLNEQPDKAIDAFCRLIEVNSETVETHLALGNLFRRRGEVDRAIRVHQNLVARGNLSAEQRGYALLELGEDYMRAGLFDRAENLFRELVELGLHQRRALIGLREIFEQEKEWEECLHVARELSSLTGEVMGPEIAHYHCELAEEARRKGNAEAAWSHLREAQMTDEHCVRASLLEGQIEMERGDLPAAARCLRKAERQDPAYLSEIFPVLLLIYRRLGDREAMIDELMKLYRRREDPLVMQAVAELIREDQGPAAAATFVAEHLKHHPDLAGMERLLSLGVELPADEGVWCNRLDLLLQATRQLLEKRPAYQCHHCGFAARRLHWQCPSCKHWGSVKQVPSNGSVNWASSSNRAG
jgi:lipopolysaccharide assembly protein B